MHALSPPRGSVWDRAIDCTSFAFFDLEMTGLDPARDAIVEIGVIRVTPGAPTLELNTRVSTDVAITDAAHSVHGLAAEATAPTFAAVADRVRELLCDAVPVGHGVIMDLAFLSRAFTTAGVAMPELFALDTLTLARRAIATPRYTLSALTTALALPARGWHRAFEDATAVRNLFERIAPVFSPTSARDLWEVRAGQRGRVEVRRSIAERLEALLASRSTCTLVTRARGSSEQATHGVVERWVAPRVRIRETNGGLRVVRADRVLRIEGDSAVG